MVDSKRPIKVINLGQLGDGKLVRELKKRLEGDGLGFIVTEECRQKIEALPSDRKPWGEGIEALWQSLVQNAVTFLKMSDPREWAPGYGAPRSPDEFHSLQAFGVERLSEYFKQFKKFEEILYGAVDYYRGHTLHVIRVWMLGALLLHDLFSGGDYPSLEFFDYVSRKTGKHISELVNPQEIQAMWCIIALSHDLGYPLQKVDDINEQTREMLRQYAKVNLQDLNFDVPQQHQFINDFILKFISSQTVFEDEYRRQLKSTQRALPAEERVFRSHVQAKYYLKYSKSLEDFEHGIFSSILLMKSLTYFLESDYDMDDLKPLDYEDAKQCAVRREILRAIACHTCQEIYHIRPDTLGFLLILCDELQSWGRPTFREMMVPPAPMPIANLKKFSSQEVEYQLKLPGDEKDLCQRTKGIFRHFHKILRVAVDAPQRKFTCRITVKSKGGLPDVYTFDFEAEKKKPKVHFMKNGEEWDPWK
jgi:hypothetical protein